MEKYRIYFALLIASLSLASYEVGDILSIDDQNIEFSICHGGEGTLSLSDYNGDLNGGEGYIILIDISASWCQPCQENNSRIELLEELYHGSDTPNFITITALNDIIPGEDNENLTCQAYGDIDNPDAPIIVEDNYIMSSWVGEAIDFPSYILIDQNMKILDFLDQGDLPLANFCPVIYNHILECGEYCNNSYSGIIGDVNSDFIVNILDCIVLVNLVMGNLEYNCENLTMGNNNGDMVIDILDVIETLQIALNN